MLFKWYFIIEILFVKSIIIIIIIIIIYCLLNLLLLLYIILLLLDPKTPFNPNNPISLSPLNP